MSKGLEALKYISHFTYFQYGSYKDKLDAIEKELKAFEIIKDFVWMENGEIHLGLYGDVEIILTEGDFESKEKYDLLKEMLK